MMNRNTTFFAALCLALAPALSAAVDSYTVDSRHTFPSFEISHIGFSTQRGRFDRTSGKISLDAKNQKGTIEIAIDADSIDTGLAELEAKLREKEFFNTVEHSSVTYKSEKIEFSGDAPVATDGSLTLLGVTKPLRLTIDHFRCGIHPISKRSVCGADASGSIKRSDFGMNAFLPAVGDEVKIKIQVEAFKD